MIDLTAEHVAVEESAVAARAGDGATVSPVRIYLISFVVLFTAEWGDLSQLLTA